MTAAIRDLREDARSRRLLAISLAVLAVIGITIAWFTFAHVRDLWQGRHDIAVTWDPEPTAERTFRAPGSHRSLSPEETRFVVRSQGRLLLFDADEKLLADLGEVDEVAWVSEDVLVAFGQGFTGDFEGLAVIDLADQSVEQVDTGGRTDDAFSPVAVTDDSLVEVCSMVYDSASSNAHCTPDRFLIDPATAGLSPA